MPRAEYPFWAAIRTIREGLSGRAGLQAYRTGGGHVQDATWYKMLGEARAQLSARDRELSAPLNRRPTGDEITVWTTKTKTGYLQQVSLIVKDRETGEITTLSHSTRGTSLLTRQEAIDAAMETYDSDSEDRYRQTILGAIYTGTYQLVPGV